MATPPCVATVRNDLDFNSVNVRAGAGIHTQVIAALPVGTSNIAVLEVKADERGTKGANGRVTQWVKIALSNGQQGFLRDDVVLIVGQCGAALGYSALSAATLASTLTRVERPAPAAAAAPAASIDNSPDRIRRAAFNITAGFEGGGYATYQNYDAGVVSYGRFQFTLAAGSLFSVLDRYLQTAQGDVANQLRAAYAGRIQAKDEGLRNDVNLKNLLIAAANDPIMQAAQDAIATEIYWTKVQNLSIIPRNVRTPLGQALFFDMAINHGPMHDMIGLAEQAIGVPPKSRIGENGKAEPDLIAKVAEIRRDRLYRIADKNNLPGLKPRGDFWVAICQAGDWNLVGDAQGSVTIKQGRIVQVRTP